MHKKKQKRKQKTERKGTNSGGGGGVRAFFFWGGGGGGLVLFWERFCLAFLRSFEVFNTFIKVMHSAQLVLHHTQSVAPEDWRPA